MSKKTASAEPALSAHLRRYLYFTAAITGAAIMIIEILGAKMLAPYFGTSHFVWTAQIAVTLVALAGGYYVGGRMADSSAKLSRLYYCILVAGLYVALSIAFVEPIAYRCLEFRLALGSLLASSFLFLIPLALLAMTGPFLVRVVTFAVQDVGGNAGRLTAVSTLGSVAGTILIGYVLVPLLPNSMTMFLTSTMLLAVVVAYYVVWGRRGQNGTAIAAGVTIALLGGLAGVRRDALAGYGGARELFRGNSNFGLLQVLENTAGTRRSYLNDFLTQNTYDPHTKKSLSLFTYMLHDLARAYAPRIEKALCIGLGVGIVPMRLAREGVSVDVVEINPAVAPVATRFFDCELNRIHLEIGDGRSFLNKAGEHRYDVVVLDAFLGDSSPAHLMTRESFVAVRRVLKEDGVIVINIFGDFSPERGFLTASLEKTLKAVFASVRIHAVGNGNVFFVASARPQLEILHPPDLADVHPSVRSQAESAFSGVRTTSPEIGMVLTDNYNPVEFRDAANREAWRRALALSMQSL